jgi:hypothetical protein
VIQSVTTEQAAKGLKYTHRSYSQVRQLRTCGEQFRLERIERAPSKPSCPAVAGTAVHTGTETVDKLLHEAPPVSLDKHRNTTLVAAALPKALEALDAEIAKFVEKGWETSQWKRYGRKTKEKPNAEDIEWFRTVGIPKSIAAYVDWRLANPDFVLAEVPGFGPAIEVPFNYYVGDQLIHGFIDRIFTSKTVGGFYPVDLKSGLKPKTDEQLGLYAQALHKALGWEIHWGYYLYGLKTGEAKLTPPITVDHWTDEKLGQIYLPATKLIDLQIFLPNPGEACFNCGVSDSCAFARSVI